mmetsp:Transcript_39626/g.117904  ORF Transcript_39626/g.117904 Transcript_39626/m.117904 type:complete len:251 (-) Transcript_39626:853-1605(-)
MRGRATLCLGLLALLAVGSPAWAQDADCSKEQQDAAAAQRQLESCQSQSNDIASRLKAAEAQVVELTSALSSALKSARELDIAGLFSATVSLGVRTASSAASEIRAASTGLQKGDTKPLVEMFQKAAVSGVQVAQGVASAASSALDEHAPLVRKYCTQASASAATLYAKHVAPLPAVQAMEKAFAETRSKVGSVVDGHIKSQPALAPLGDDATLSGLTYALLFAPLALVFMLPLCLRGGAKKPARHGGHR